METVFAKLAGMSALFAEGAPAPQGGEVSPLLQSMPLFLAIFVLFYFLLVRPQRREQARRQALLNAIKKNDRVVTIGGVYGVVMNVQREADEVTIKVDEATNTKLRVTLSSIGRVLGDEPSDESAK